MLRRIFKNSRRWLSAAILATPAIAVASSAAAQELAPPPIRVESKQVLVPVMVYHRQLWEDLFFGDPADLEDQQKLRNLIAKVESVPIRDLTAQDFRLFEDGHEQTIENVTVASPGVDEVHDNAGRHYEYRGPGGGRWIYPDIPNDGKVHTIVPYFHYVLAYTPPPGQPGNCHKVRIAIRNHRDAMVSNLSEYCRTQLSPLDPLRDTKFGQRMDSDLTVGQNGRIPILLATGVFFDEGLGQARVQVTLEFPPKSLRWFELEGFLEETIGMLGRVYRQDGRQADSVSDFACCQNHRGLGIWGGRIIDAPGHRTDMIEAPSSYETQIPLQPGDYRFRVLISDGPAANIAGFERGSDFGRVELPITVPALDPQHLALSDIALARRFRQASTLPKDDTAEPFTAYIPLVSKGVEYTPTSDSTFKKTDEFLFFFQLYDPVVRSDSGCSPLTPAATTPQPGGGSVATNASSTSAAPAIPSRCLPQAQIKLRIVDAKSGAAVRNLAALKAADFAIPGNPIIPIGSGIHIDDLPPGDYQLQAQASTLVATPASLNIPPTPPQTTPWHSVSFTIR